MGSRRVASIGVGKMGGPMALHLHRQFGLAAIFSPRTAKTFAAKNDLPDTVRLAASPKDAAASGDTVVVSVPIQKVESVLFGGDGVGAGVRSGSLVIESGNSDHRRDAEYEGKLAAKGVSYLECGVSGGPKRARAGDLVAIVGGKTETFDAARDVFESFCQPPNVFHVGPTGQGHEAKMYHNEDEQNDMRNIGEAISILMASGMTFRDAFEALDKGHCKSSLLTYAGKIPDEEMPRIAAKVGGGDLPQIAVETAEAIGHASPFTCLTLNLRRFSRGEMTPDVVAAHAEEDFRKKGVSHILRLYNLLRERAPPTDIPGDGDVQVVARVLALGYLLDLAEVVSIAHHRRIDVPILARVFRAGLCDKAALDPLLTATTKELKEFPDLLPKEDRQAFEEGIAVAAKLGHPAPSAAAYIDLDLGTHTAKELRKLSHPKAKGKYDNALRVQAGIRNAFGEHGYERVA